MKSKLKKLIEVYKKSTEEMKEAEERAEYEYSKGIYGGYQISLERAIEDLENLVSGKDK